MLFKAEESAWTPSAVQIQQVSVDPEARGNGYASRGLRDLCRLLLASAPADFLFVRSENAPAIALYDSIGMRRVLEYRSILFEPPPGAPDRARLLAPALGCRRAGGLRRPSLARPRAAADRVGAPARLDARTRMRDRAVPQLTR